MKRNILITAGLGLTLLAGCVVTSVYPFYFEKDIIFEPALLGDWQKTDKAAEHWKFERDKGNGYRIAVVSENKQSKEQGHFFKLGGLAFLDLCAIECEQDVQPEPVPTHLLFRVNQLKPTVKMAALDYDWLKQLLAQNPKAIRHIVIRSGESQAEGRIVLTADTADLQRFVLKHLATKEAWSDTLELQPAAVESQPR